MSRSIASLLGLAAALALGGFRNPAEATSFANINPISLPASGSEGIANPYPSMINVSGLSGVIGDINVIVGGLYHTFPDDLDLLLVGPSGHKVILMSDAGGPHDLINVTIMFDDEAASSLANGDLLVGGSFRPSNYTGNGGPTDAFPAPAPAGPYGSLLSILDGTDPNGEWKLFVFDDQSGDAGRIANGWAIEIATAIPEPAPWILFGAGIIAVFTRRKNR